jgi:hypothetical protein
MYIHIGGDHMVRSKDIIGIFNIERTTVSQYTREYLSMAALRNSEVGCTHDLPRSFVVTFDKHDLSEKVYISRVSPATIAGRTEKG